MARARALSGFVLRTIGEAVAHVRRGGLLAYPTETLYGLGADARSEEALGRLARWKGRGAAQPVSVLVADAAALDAHGIVRSATGDALAARFWPGPLTLILATRSRFAPGVVSAEGTVGVRCSAHPAAQALARSLAAAGTGPLTATSLNRHGEPPAATRVAAAALCGDTIDQPWLCSLAALADAAGPSGVPSTVVDASGAIVRVLREGAIATADVLAAIGHSSRHELPAAPAGSRPNPVKEGSA